MLLGRELLLADGPTQKAIHQKALEANPVTRLTDKTPFSYTQRQRLIIQVVKPSSTQDSDDQHKPSHCLFLVDHQNNTDRSIACSLLIISLSNHQK